MAQDYRTIYEEHFRMTIPDGFVIHHMDRDRDNNDIDNLVMLPSKLHQQYHFYSTGDEDGRCYFNNKLDDLFSYDYSLVRAERMLEVLKQCAFWCSVKERMQYSKMMSIFVMPLQTYINDAMVRFKLSEIPMGINKDY